MNAGSYLFSLMLFEGSQQLFLLIRRNDIIGDPEQNLIFLLYMLPQKAEIGSGIVEKGILGGLVSCFRKSQRRHHRS